MFVRPHGSGIITRGFNHSTVITRGYGGRLIEVFERIYRSGRSSASRMSERIDEIVVYAKLLFVNDESPTRNVVGTVRTSYDRSSRRPATLVEHLSTRIKRVLSDIVISVTRTWRDK